MLKARSSEREEPVIAREGLGKHVTAAADTHSTIELLEAVFSMWSASFSMQSVPRLNNDI
jgi:hypothetical protein